MAALLADPDRVPHMPASVTYVKPHHAQPSKACDYCGCEEMPVLAVQRKCGQE